MSRCYVRNPIVSIDEFAERKRFRERRNGFIAENERYVTLRLHNTDIVTIDKMLNIVTLNSGGYRTQTTKRWINEVLEIYGVPMKVVQKKKQWEVVAMGHDIYMERLFEDGMEVRF